ncbi:MAG: MFS transporter [Opitutaceae bacterium]
MTAKTLHPHRLTWLCYGSMMALAIGLNLLPVFLTSISATYGGSEGLSGEELGRLGAMAFAGLVLGILITGPLADRYGAKLFAQLGNLLTILSLLLAAWAPTYLLLSLSLFLLGSAAGMLDMILSPIVAALNPERRTVAMNWLHSFYCIGAVVTILAGMLVRQAGGGWTTACLALIPLPLFLSLAFAPLRFPSLQAEGAVRTRLRTLLKGRWFVLALVAIFLGGATELGMAQWLPAYAETALGFPIWMAGGSLLAFSLAMAAGRIFVGILGHRVGPFQIVFWACASSTVLFAGASFLPSPVGALACCIGVGFTGSALWPTILAMTADRYPNGGATMYSALAAFGNAGGIFMPWVVGWVADRSDLHWGLFVSALAPFLMLPLVVAMSRGSRTSG